MLEIISYAAKAAPNNFAKVNSNFCKFYTNTLYTTPYPQKKKNCSLKKNLDR